ncbi:MAG: hypothetical protein GY697_22795 [Desulfobacterales bacterium]|nr:hypothetical protein [Desulfobacterales bacterium]
MKLSVPHPSSTELRGRQSVRATFKLTEKAIETISVLAVHLRIKQKSLFDHLIEDTGSLNTIAQDVNKVQFKTLDRVQKTYVLSRRTLSILDQISKHFATPRDAIVEYSVHRLLPVIEREKEKHRIRKKLLFELDDYCQNGLRLLKNAQHQLGADDPFCEKLETAVAGCGGSLRDLSDFVARCADIENY